MPEHLNDDCLGRVLDKLSAKGLTEIFVTVALAAAKKMGVESNSLHLDSSSFHVDGKYTQANEIEETETAGIKITHGYLILFKLFKNLVTPKLVDQENLNLQLKLTIVSTLI